MEPKSLSPYSQQFATYLFLIPRLLGRFRNIINFFYGEELLAPRLTPKLEDHPLRAVRDCLLSIFASTLHI
jgi:hypothetical protein